MSSAFPSRLLVALIVIASLSALTASEFVAAADLAPEDSAERQIAALLDDVRRSGDHRELEGEQLQSAYSLYHVMFYDVMEQDRTLTPAGLRPDQLPVLLAMSGYRQPNGPAVDDPQRVPLELVSLLAALRRDGEAEQLDEIAVDSRQGTTPRIVANLALFAAGEEIDFTQVARLLSREKRLHHRLLCVLMFLHCPDQDLAGEVLLPLLEDRNVEIRAAAVYSIRATRPAEGLMALIQLLHRRQHGANVSTVLDAIAEYENSTAAEAIATFVEDALKKGAADDVYNAIGPFASVTGQSFYEAGAHSRDYYVEQARLAMTWWHEHQRQQVLVAARVQAETTRQIRQAFVEQVELCLEARALRTGEPQPKVLTTLLEQPELLRVQLLPWSRAADQIAAQLPAQETPRLVRLGEVASLDRVGDCWQVVTPERFGVSLTGCLDQQTLSLSFLAVVPRPE
jgi:hypothetical protein